MKYVIARNEGPIGSTNGKLIPGHKYEVLYRTYQDSNGNKSEIPLVSNPRQAEFYIRVKDDTDINSWSIWFTGEHTYWNDYFLSTEEMREYKLDIITDGN